ncbi:threonine aldolase family protein [Pseudoroseicyclus aestuarii]|uniref:L-threonine aldolase n=1 Tax=Pseudoroseicyclus aestuarii TaxID=1795041 RepID=A0A318SPW7_9RHOB|nr:beta-eliminating lyase-related protein [Pseudoroseicyclus aestuarii]PYE82388.1 L-threonine aldolase [Pseudoroseicyclus aestuarii]
MFLVSDNTGPVHPSVLEALTRANEAYVAGYGADDASARAVQAIRDLFEAPEAAVHLVATGTAANSLILASMAQPWSTIFCAPMAHIQEDECNAPEFFSGGAKLTLVEAENAKITPAALRAAIAAEQTRGVHGPKRGPVSITNATEKGTVYSPAEVAALAEVTKEYGLPLHMDGARFSNAVAALGCTPAEITWKAGVSALSFGGTKNGLMGVEAAVFFDPALAAEFEYRRKRGGHLFSKHRYLSAQMEAYIEGDLWHDLATRANEACAHLLRGLRQIPQVEIAFEPEANIIFASFPREMHQRLRKAGAQYSVWSGDVETGDPAEMLTARMVTDWSQDLAQIDHMLAVMRGA